MEDRTMKKFKAIATKVAIKMVVVLWMAVGFAITLYAMYVTAVVLGEYIPDGTPVWVRLVICVPSLLFAPLSVEVLYIEISRRIDRLTGHRILGF